MKKYKLPAKIKAKTPDPEGLQLIKLFLMSKGIKYVTELRFDPVRRWRFDIALPDHKIAIEYEGMFAAKSRHLTVTGFSEDCTKYNNALIAGWRVLRYSAITYKQFYNDIDKLIA